MGACGAGATLQAGPRGPGPSFSLAISLLWGEGRGISVTLAPHHCLIAGQHLHGLKLDRAPLCTPGSPGLSTTGTLPASDPQESCSQWHWVPPAPVFTHSWGVLSGGGAAVVILGCHRCWVQGVSPRGPCRDTAPGPRCSGPGSVLASPRHCLGPSQPAPALEWSPQTGGMKGRDS